MKEREFTVVFDVEDSEGPNDTNEGASLAMKEFILDSLEILRMNVKNIIVSCK